MSNKFLNLFLILIINNIALGMQISPSNPDEQTLTDRKLARDLFNASRNGDKQMVEKVLSKRNCLVNVRDQSGNTPLIWAVVYKHYEVVEILIKNGALVYLMNDSGQQAKDYADSGKIYALQRISIIQIEEQKKAEMHQQYLSNLLGQFEHAHSLIQLSCPIIIPKPKKEESGSIFVNKPKDHEVYSSENSPRYQGIKRHDMTEPKRMEIIEEEVLEEGCIYKTEMEL